MQVTVANNYVNTRSSLPSLNSPNASFLVPGQTIEIDGKFYKGDSFQGNDIWVRDLAGNYYWSGGFNLFQWWISSLNIPEIWGTYNEMGANAKIAVLDSGYNTGNSEIVVVDSYDAVNTPANINDTDGHGTYCTSIIGSRNINNIIGCAPLSKIYSAKITNSDSSTYLRICNAIGWAVKMNVDVISISYGGPGQNSALEDAINDAVNNHNILVIASIGDNSPPNGQSGGFYPALCDKCLAVGATDQSNNLLGVTMLNQKTEINAPGTNINAYTLTNTPSMLPDGTSQAAAAVAGICALIISRHKFLNKSYSVQSIKDLVTQNFDSVNNNSAQKLISPLKIFQKI